MKVLANGIMMNYDMTGTSGKTLVLIHGSDDNMEAWWPQVPAFSAKYRGLRYDMRGHGQTETPEATLAPEIWVEELYQLLKRLRDAFSGPEAAKRVGETLGGAPLRVLPTGHASNIEAPEEFNGIVLEFLEKAGSPQ